MGTPLRRCASRARFDWLATSATLPANTHLLRERRLRHVFIGLGDSDKTVSTGRYAKVYDEIWAAGPAGRARWREADVGVDDDAVVEVGAPFVDASAGVVGPGGAGMLVAAARGEDPLAPDRGRARDLLFGPRTRLQSASRQPSNVPCSAPEDPAVERGPGPVTSTHGGGAGLRARGRLDSPDAALGVLGSTRAPSRAGIRSRLGT